MDKGQRQTLNTNKQLEQQYTMNQQQQQNHRRKTDYSLNHCWA